MVDLSLPHNLEAEKSVLGSMLIEKEALHKAIDILNPEDFYLEKHQFIFNTILSLCDKNKEVDTIILANELKEKDKLNEVGGVPYLQGLINSVSVASNAPFYIEIVYDNKKKRDIIRAINKINTLCFQKNMKSPELLEQLEKDFLRLCEGVNFYEETTEEIWDKMLERIKTETKDTSIPSGFIDIDKVVELDTGRLWVVGGLPGIGKTSFFVNMSLNLIRR